MTSYPSDPMTSELSQPFMRIWLKSRSNGFLSRAAFKLSDYRLRKSQMSFNILTSSFHRFTFKFWTRFQIRWNNPKSSIALFTFWWLSSNTTILRLLSSKMMSDRSNFMMSHINSCWPTNASSNKSPTV